MQSRRGVLGSRGMKGLAVIHFPIAFGMKAHLEQAVPGIVALAAAGADQIAAPCRSLMIVVLGDRKGRAATARDEEHPQAGVLLCVFFGLGRSFHDSSTTAYELFFRLFDCKTFLRRRSAFGVISTNSSSAMNSMACSRLSGRKGTRRMASSAVEARILVSFFSRTALTSRSVSLAFSPMIMPS